MKYVFTLLIAFYALTCCTSKKSQKALNDSINISEKIMSTPPDHSVWNNLLKKHVSKEGIVNYKGIKDDYPKLKSYLDKLSQESPNNSWSKEETLAYWINTYNAVTVDLILKHYPVKSIKDIDDPWEQKIWKQKGKWVTLDAIEHDILRKMDEPRIHFAIVCASYSCPKLSNEAYNPITLEKQLAEATRTFLADPKRNTISENKLELSKIFKWFSKDFKQNGSLIEFLNKYSDVTISQNAKTSYKDYNWALNE